MSNDLALTVPLPAQRNTQRRLSESEKRAIVAAVGVKGSIQQVANEFNVHRNTVSALCNDVRKNVPQSVLGASWRAEVESKAVLSVTRALDDDTDVYKSANIGVQALKGLGIFNADAQVNVSALVTAWPADLMTPLQVDGD